MAQRTIVTTFDDLDGSEGAETLTFGLDGRTYEIDLTPENEDELRGFLERYIKAGRRQKQQGTATRTRSTSGTSRTEVGPSTEVVRKWAQSNGYEVKERGRIPASIREAYDKANA